MPTAAELQAAAAAAAQYTQTAEQAAMLNAAYRANQLPVIPQYGAGGGITREQYEDAQNEAIKHQIAFSQPRNDVRQLSGEAARISQEYAASRNRVVTGGGVSYQGPAQQYNPYGDGNAAAIAWEVGRTGGATDYQMNLIAEREVVAAGGDPGFIRYATDIYQERPQFEREILTTREGQQFENKEWYGVPIRLNLTKAEMAAGGGITDKNFGKYLRYDTGTYQLNRLEAQTAQFGIDTGVHKARGDFGGPWLKDGAYGGWRSGGGRIVGGKTVASVATYGNLEQQPATKKLTLDDTLNAAKSQAVGFANVFLPGASGFLPSVRAEQSEASKQFGASLSAGDVGGAYAAAEKYFFATSPTRAMPDVSEFDTEVRIKESDMASDVFTFGASTAKQVYTNIRENPMQTAALVALPGAFKIGEVAITRGVAWSAMSKAPVISTAGRLASTPLAADFGTYAIKGGLVGMYAYESGMSIVKAEGAKGKGAAFGNVAYQVGAMSVGAPLAGAIKIRAPENAFAGREFFSGKLAMSPAEKAVFRAETIARSVMTSDRAAYRDVATISRFGRFEEPMRKATPEIERTSAAGPYAKQIRSVLAEQEHSMIGSSTVRQQYPKEIATEFGIREGKDVDTLIYSPKKAIASLSKKTGLTEEAAKGVMDVHPIPPQYPRLKPSVETDITADESSFASRIFGDPYRRVATPRSQSEVIIGKEYRGKETYEAVQVQYGRKSAAVAAVIESPITKGYRAEKDIYDFVGLYRAQRKVAITRGAKPESFKQSDIAMERFLGREIEIGTVKGQKIGDASPTRRVKVSQLFEEGKAGAMERPAPQYEPAQGYIPRVGRSYVLPSRGVVSAFGSISPAGSTVAYRIGSEAGSVQSRIASLYSPSERPSVMSSIRSPSVSSIMGSLRSPVSPRSPSLFTRSSFTPSASRRVTSGYTPAAARSTSFSTPASTPSRALVVTSIATPTMTPPSSPPTRMPPPDIPPSVPRIPGGGFFPGGGGSRHPGNLGVTQWRRENLVADMPYLARGMRQIYLGIDAGSGSEKWFGGKKKRRKSKKK